MIASAALRLIVSEPQMLFITGCSLPEVLPFSVCFLFFIYRICFPFFWALLFCWRLIAAVTWCEMNSLENGQKFTIAKVRLLTLTRTWKRTKDESCRQKVFTWVQFQCVKSGLHGCTLAKYEHASQVHEPVYRTRPMSFQHAIGMWGCGNLYPWGSVPLAE